MQEWSSVVAKFIKTTWQKDPSKTKNITCLLSGLDGHWRNSCPMRGKKAMESCGRKFGYQRGERPDKQLFKRISSMQTPVAANLRYAEVFLGDKEPIRLQLDSGADITIVTVRNWEKTESPDLQRSVAKVMTGTGSPINIIGH